MEHFDYPEDPFHVIDAHCDGDVWHSFHKGMEEKLWRVDALLLATAIMVGVIVGIDAYSKRYRHHPFTRFIYLGATTLFLPIISSVVSSINTGFDYTMIIHDIWEERTPSLMAVCNPDKHSVLVVTWALLVQNVLINTSVVVAVDEREGRSTGPPMELLAQGVWVLYLGIGHIYILQATYRKHKNLFLFIFGDYEEEHHQRAHTLDFTLLYLLEVLPFVLTLAKLAFKFYAAKYAQQSLAFGRNPRLVSRYMRQLQPMVLSAPPLLVMGEESRHVNKHPHGYVLLMDDDGNSGSRTMSSSLHKQSIDGLMTVDRVWQQLDGNNGTMLLPVETAQRLKDLCLSFALFKLLRCRFARYELVSGSDMKNTFGYFWSLLLNDSEPADRVFRVTVDSLSFLHDYYYSSLPISYSKCWLPIVGILISLSSIGYCIFLSVWMIHNKYGWERHQIECVIRCKDVASTVFGSLLIDVVPLFLLLVFVVTAELREMASYICSNWTKVVVTCRLILRRDHHSLSMLEFKWSAYLLRCRCRLMKHQFWDERMGQCSVLPLQAGTRTPFALLGRRLLHLPDQKTKLNPAVKVSIIDALRSCRSNNGGHLSNGRASLSGFSHQVGDDRFLWACNSESTSDVILTWQIATNILEVRYPPRQMSRKQSSSSVTSDPHRTVATQLSRYCVYLVNSCPELLPDDDAWSKSLYEDVKKDAERALARPCCAVTFRYLCVSLASTTPGYQELVDLLSANANSKNQVLNDGVKLGKQLVEKINDEEAAWKLLADFWSEMILYVAPSDNLKGHKKSIARGGELITLLWALLGHAGIISRPDHPR
ncbi:unnamed protein product [Urochloa decumbens]|uniref:DUF4220 domain-containing protein n=1 Tax=Urochloa decumbens TaxID=240449 RepID=A0ABC9AQU6_9POAL